MLAAHVVSHLSANLIPISSEYQVPVRSVNKRFGCELFTSSQVLGLGKDRRMGASTITQNIVNWSVGDHCAVHVVALVRVSTRCFTTHYVYTLHLP